MNYKIEFRPLATLEMLEAYDWYEAQKEGLGAEFMKELDLFFDALLQNPKTHSFYFDTIRQGKIKCFPYTVVYDIFDNNIIVYSVFMTKQNPSKKPTK